jgi:ribosomal protein S18 acetylase RimI-like enzyme
MWIEPMFNIRPLANTDLEPLRRFTDREIGAGYYSLTELESIFRRSQKSGLMCSLLLVDPDDMIVGVRISFPPGQWEAGKGDGLASAQWPYPLADTGYFQSIFLSSRVQGQGWGGKLSSRALELLRKVGAKGVVCHSWKESPHNSSTRYLLKLGFAVVAEHPRYWQDVPYNCTRCLQPPCQCTAQEMYLDLEKKL